VVPVTRGEPAKVYPFKLDPFQQEAVDHIERGESVLVAAHTSAGKTAVAEYAIAKSLKNGQRVIYTSPIKALSNQKYRDLLEEFGDVGLMTGDMTLNPNATCLIMTTEILRSMLYRGSEIMREVAWVIYDEVHYMRDKERGVVWEESIILLPHKVRFVFLSATIPNAEDFVSWVRKIHHQPCHVVYTEYRPVPLQHYVFPAGTEGLHLVVDEKGKFRDDNFQRAMSLLQSGAPQPGSEGGDGKGGKPKKQTKSMNSDLVKIIKLIMERQLDPCIIFSFSKKDCEAYALQMARLEFNNEEEKALVESVFVNAMDSLSEDDKALPAVQTILPLLKNGVGIHHGGLLPILKEVIEILFQEGLIKCLFATETFSIGINMPAKTVVFTQTRKFDGQDFRWITSGEYIQMSGRAGRRGKDDKGIVIQMLDEKMEPEVAKNMIYGASDPLYSSYHVGYNMVLNMLRVEDSDPLKLIRSSFHQFQQERDAPVLEKQSGELRAEAETIEIADEKVVQNYTTMVNLLAEKREELKAVASQPKYSLPFLQAGRMVEIVCSRVNWGWGVIVNVRKMNQGNKTASLLESNWIRPSGATSEYVIDVLLEIRVPTPGGGEVGDLAVMPLAGLNRCHDGSDARGFGTDVVVVHVNAECIAGISAVKLALPQSLTLPKARASVQKSVAEVQRRFLPPAGEGIPLLDITKDLGVPEELAKPFLSMCKELSGKIEASKFHSSADRDAVLDTFDTKSKLLAEAAACLSKAKESQSVVMKEQLKKMKRVLRRLEFTTTDDVLALKGRFSCELSTGDELVLTNLVFDGAFNDLTVAQVVALLSCFVFKEENKDTGSNPRIRPDMQAPYRQLQSVARSVAKVCVELKLVTDEEEYVDAFNPGLVDVAYAWCTGAKFADICKLTDTMEGSIIRVLRRLEELLRQLASASLAIGNSELKNMFEEGSARIRRGVVFAASLYL